MTAVQLRLYLTYNKVDTRFFLEAALKLTALVGELHQQGIHQLNVSPDNIAYDPDTGRIEIIDWSLKSSNAYMSPEQTGRIGRHVDHRSGLYKLGITFYEMLTGHRPFEARNNNEWVYMHLAVRPKPLGEVRPDVPQVVCELVMKLLSKNAEERYQSAHTLKFDLQRCSREWNESGAIIPFPLGELDEKSRFQPPQALYEREHELEQLLAMYERTCSGSKELWYISGRSGSGKTALIKEFQARIVHRQGYFISGKFDQMKKEIPYTPIIQVLRELVRYVLSEDPGRILRWKKKLKETLGRSGTVITEVIPEAAFLLGEQKPLEALSSVDAMNRFKFLFMRFIKVFIDKERPLVLFFDDVQWADQASLDFIKLLVADPNNRYIAVIGAGRVNSWDKDSVIEEAANHFQKEIGVDIQKLQLNSLSLSSITQILSDTLQESREKVKALAEIVFQKTAGNPFYIYQYLYSIYSGQLLQFHMEKKEWEWDLGLIKERELSDDVIGLILERLHKLPQETLHVLNLAGTLGNTFDLKTLSLVYAQDLAKTAEALVPALEEGLLLVCKELGLSGKETDQVWEEQGVTYTFLHDRVHEAVYNLMNEKLQKQLHLHIGRKLQESWSSEKQAERIFELVHHLNKGSELIHDAEEKYGLARLNLQAGIKAKASIAFASALGYFNAGMAYLQREPAASNAPLVFRLLIEKPECEYFCGYFEQAEATIAELFELAADPLDRAKVALIQVEMYAYLKKKEALTAGLKAMSELGLHIPVKATKASIIRKVIQANFMLNKQKDRLQHLPESKDPYQQVLAELTMAVASSAVIEDPELSVIIFASYVMHGLAHGKTEAFPFILGSYATVLCLGFGRYQTGYRLAEIALGLAETYDNPKVKSRIHFIFGLILQYRRPKDSVNHFKTSSKFGLEAGDVNYVGFSMALLANNASGDLNQLQDLCKEYFETASRFLDSMIMRHLQIVTQYIAALQGLTRQRTSFTNESFDETSLFEEANVSITQKKQYFYYYACKIEVCYLFGYYEEAMAWVKQLEIKSEETYAPVMIHKHWFFHFLTVMEQYPKADWKEKRIYRRLLAKQLRQMKRWARSCPQSALHKYYLMDAEMQRLKGNDLKAQKQYNLAITSAKEEGLVQYEALGSELAAKYYLSVGNETLAKAYMLESAHKYRLWGATEKVKALCEAYPALVPESNPDEDAARKVAPTNLSAPSLKEIIENNESGEASIMNRKFDLNTILQARTMAPNAERNILEQFLDLAIVHAGAERGYILQDNNGELIVEAELDKKWDRDKPAHVVADFEKGRHFSKAVVQYVIRTQESVVLSEASYHWFASDPYMERKQPKSILCMPIHYPGKFSGAVYLENNLISGVFTEDLTEILDIVLTRMLYLNTVRMEADHQALKAGSSER